MGEEDIKTRFERCCRLCAEEQEVTIMIFSEEAKAMLLLNKLNKYLLIEVEEDDKLPKNICIACCGKLQTVCDFIESTRHAQEVLLNRSSMVEQFVAEQKETVTVSVKLEPRIDDDDEYKFTEMEISVDPMMVLQNSEETTVPLGDLEDEEEYITQDVTHMHSVDQENVTIKIIRKGYQLDLSSKPFQCLSKGCDRRFLTELALKNHSWVHCGYDDNEEKAEKNKKYFKCNTCDDSFDFKADLIAHLKAHRISGRCHICGRCFRTEKNLSAHMAAHLSSKSYSCKICGRSYNTRSNLKTHSITHSSERPYECHICKKTFKRNQDLKFHINQHTGAKPYQCPFCDKSFASSGNCYSHRNRMHPGRRVESKVRRKNRENQSSFKPSLPKPSLTSVKGMFKYQCTMCDHSFMKRDNFTYHMYQHTGEKPFHCSLCTETFVTRRGLLIHHDKEHPGKDRPLALISKNVLLK